MMDNDKLPAADAGRLDLPVGRLAPERAAIIARARKLRAEIAQTFADAEHWNRVHVPWKGKPIDPDPDGQLQRIAEGIDRMLAHEG